MAVMTTERASVSKDCICDLICALVCAGSSKELTRASTLNSLGIAIFRQRAGRDIQIGVIGIKVLRIANDIRAVITAPHLIVFAELVEPLADTVGNLLELLEAVNAEHCFCLSVLVVLQYI